MSPLYGAAYLTLYGAGGFAEFHGKSLHGFCGEGVGKAGEQDISGGGAVGFRDFRFFGNAIVEDIEDVVVVSGDYSDNGEGYAEIGVGAFDFLRSGASVHAPEGGEHHRDAQQRPRQAMCAGVVEVSVALFHLLFFFCEEVVEFLLLDDGEAEPYGCCLPEALVEAVHFFAEFVEDCFQWVVGVIAGEAVNLFVGGGHAVEYEAAQESVLGIWNE